MAESITRVLDPEAYARAHGYLIALRVMAASSPRRRCTPTRRRSRRRWATDPRSPSASRRPPVTSRTLGQGWLSLALTLLLWSLSARSPASAQRPTDAEAGERAARRWQDAALRDAEGVARDLAPTLRAHPELVRRVLEDEQISPRRRADAVAYFVDPQRGDDAAYLHDLASRPIHPEVRAAALTAVMRRVPSALESPPIAHRFLLACAEVLSARDGNATRRLASAAMPVFPDGPASDKFSDTAALTRVPMDIWVSGCLCELVWGRLDARRALRLARYLHAIADEAAEEGPHRLRSLAYTLGRLATPP